MFCQKCGRWIRKEFKLCPGCGVSPTNDSHKLQAQTSSQVQNLKEFKDLKTKERTQFVAKTRRARRAQSDRTATVIITIGITVFSKGTVKPIRGKSLPLRINKSATAETLREEALKKRRAYDKSFRNHCAFRENCDSNSDDDSCRSIHFEKKYEQRVKYRPVLRVKPLNKRFYYVTDFL